jgi:hypothetical protein
MTNIVTLCKLKCDCGLFSQVTETQLCDGFFMRTCIPLLPGSNYNGITDSERGLCLLFEKTLHKLHRSARFM